MSKIGLTLSGGGVRGFFHSGFLHALNEKKINIDIISGTSAGAIAGALFSAGVNQHEVMERFPKRIRSLFYEPSLLIRTKFNPTSILRQYMDEFLGGLTIEQLAIPIKINAVNIATGDTEIFQTGDVVEAVMASCAIPGVFNSFHSNGNIYVDGGLTMNLPASTIRYDCDILIGVNLLPFKERSYEKLPGKRHLIQRSVDIYHKHNNKSDEALCDVVISPKKLSRYPTYNTTNKAKLFDLGYEVGHKINFRKILKESR